VSDVCIRRLVRRVKNWFERTLDNNSHQAAPDVHRIGSSGARIVRVTEKRVEYIDAAGRGQFVDVEECARNWVRWCHNHRQDFLPLGGASQAEIEEENARTVGLRGGSYPLWWAEFMNQRKTRFEFGTSEDRWGKLQGPLMVAGWRTFDTE